VDVGHIAASRVWQSEEEFPLQVAPGADCELAPSMTDNFATPVGLAARMTTHRPSASSFLLTLHFRVDGTRRPVVALWRIHPLALRRRVGQRRRAAFRLRFSRIVESGASAICLQARQQIAPPKPSRPRRARLDGAEIERPCLNGIA
jgi:hypothetical protein